MLRLELSCYASPAFVSGGCPYYGEPEDIDEFFEARRMKDPELDAERMEAISLYKQGRTDVKHRVDYSEVTLFETVSTDRHVTLKGEGVHYLKFSNTWGFPYFMRCEGYTADICWFSQGTENLCRAVRCSFVNLMRDSDFFTLDDAIPEELEYGKVGSAWGQPCFFRISENNDWSSRLYVPERYFRTEEEYREDIQKPVTMQDIDLRRLFLEIVGDG